MLYNGEQVGDGSDPAVDIAVDPLEGTTLCAQGHAERARGDRDRPARHDVRPGPVRLHGEARRRHRPRRPARPRPPDRRDLRARRRAPRRQHRRRHGRRARPPAPRGGHRGDPRRRCARAPDQRRRRQRGAARGLRPLARRPPLGRRRDARGRHLGRRDQVRSAAASSGRLWPRDDDERKAALDAGYDLERQLTQDDLVKGDDCFFSATGVTDGDVLQGVRYEGKGVATTESLVMRSRSGTVRRVRATPQPRQAARPDRRAVRLISRWRWARGSPRGPPSADWAAARSGPAPRSMLREAADPATPRDRASRASAGIRR